MENQNEASLKKIVEGLIFAADEPITPKQIRELIEGESSNGSTELTPQKIRTLIDELNDDYERYIRPYRIQAIAGGYIFATNKDVSTFVGKLHKEQAKKRLTQTALETLAIIAYKQPITKVELETIRGVNSDYIVKSLLEKDLITITGRQQSPGRPLLYGTTNRFLIHFGLNSVNELPKPREIEELIGETELEVEKRLMEIERQKQEEEEGKQKREWKPHPLSEGAIAKIIPLKPDYRPAKERKPEPEEDITGIEAGDETKIISEPDEETRIPEPEDEPQIVEDAVDEKVESVKEDRESTESEAEQPEDVYDPATHAGHTGEAVFPEEVDADMRGESEEKQEAEITASPDLPPDEEHPHSIPEQAEPGVPAFDRGTIEPERGWKKWKNKIVKIIKKIFG